MPSTKIVCTIGPASRSEACLERLIQAGMNVARLNFSHGTHEEHAEVITRIRVLSAKLDQPVAILQDLQGPKIRTGSLRDHQPVLLNADTPFTLTTLPLVGDATKVSTTYHNLPYDVKPGDHLLLADGLLELIVQATTETDVICQVIHGGPLDEHKGINLPGVTVSAPALTEKDIDDLHFGIAQGVDFVAVSFVRKASDIQAARALVESITLASSNKVPTSHKRGKFFEGPPTLPIIAKLEKPEAIQQLDSILDAADGVMVARGDLGVELSPEKVPLLQKRIIARANERGIPIITATQMLESMVTQPRPTRAEASDVANAILDGTDAIMLSEETANGHYPVEAVEMMVRIAQETEPACAQTTRGTHPSRLTLAHAVSSAAHLLAREAAVAAIVVFTRSGKTGQIVSKERPHVPIIAYTPSEHIYRQLALWWGIIPRKIALAETTEALIAEVSRKLQQEGFIQAGEKIVIVGGMPLASQAKTNFIKLHQI